MVTIPKLRMKLGEGVFLASGSKKRGAEEELDEVQTRKKQKPDSSNMFRHCSVLLTSMMDHHFGWVFGDPVDPVRLNLPDYFSVVSKPMDLGTIKCNLAKNAYDTPKRFAADVRLTFSNAMSYNPPENLVHKMAKELNEFFEVRWRSLENNSDSEVSRTIESCDDNCSGQRSPETPTFSGSSPVSTLEPLKEKTAKVSPLSQPVEEKAKKAPHSVRPTALSTKLRLLKKLNQGRSRTHLTVKGWSKVANGGCGRHNRANGPPNAAASECGSCCEITSISLKSCSSYDNCPGSDITSRRPCGSEAPLITADCQAKSNSGSQPSKPDPHSDGSANSMNEENDFHSSRPQKPLNGASSDQELKATAFDVPLSPKKALRAAILKNRFANTILKAKQRKVLGHSNETDPIKSQQEKERLERTHREEKARTEAEIRAVEDAVRTKEKTELQIQRERQRLALQKMEETAKIEQENNLEVVRFLEKLSRSNMTSSRLLEKLGLVLKDG